MKFKAIFPFIDDMGTVDSIIVSDKPMESAEAEALWHLNRMRDHDGLEHLEELPRGFKLKPIYD